MVETVAATVVVAMVEGVVVALEVVVTVGVGVKLQELAQLQQKCGICVQILNIMHHTIL